MKFSLIVIGKTTDNYLAKAIDDYLNRIKHYVPFEYEVVPDIKNTKSMSFELQKLKTCELLLKSLQPNDEVILLDERGSEFSSLGFSQFLEKKMQVSQKRIVFVIGGAYGFSDELYKKANSKLSISKMTFSHQMIRLLFVEQFYRAMTILKGEPYHHE